MVSDNIDRISTTEKLAMVTKMSKFEHSVTGRKYQDIKIKLLSFLKEIMFSKILKRYRTVFTVNTVKQPTHVPTDDLSGQV